MTKQEAKQALQEGHYINHPLFGGPPIKLTKEGEIWVLPDFRDVVPYDEFWADKNTVEYETGYSITE